MEIEENVHVTSDSVGLLMTCVPFCVTFHIVELRLQWDFNENLSKQFPPGCKARSGV